LTSQSQASRYFRPGEGRWCVSFKNGSVGNVIQGNILSGGARGALEYDNDSSFTSDYNLVRRADGPGIATNEDIGDLYSLIGWQSLSGNDSHSLNADPKFLQPTTAPYDFRLRPGSPALDIGIAPLVPGDLRGYPRPLGSGWDMGCYEMTVWDWVSLSRGTPRRGQPLPTPRRHE
jgi:hypothetical protein